MSEDEYIPGHRYVGAPTLLTRPKGSNLTIEEAKKRLININIQCPTHGQPENSCTECKDNERKIIEGKSIRQQIEENKRKPYDGILTEKMLLEFLEDLSTKESYVNPTDNMSEKMATAFHEAQKEYVKKNY